MPENLRTDLFILIVCTLSVGYMMLPFVFVKLPQGVKIAVYILTVVVLTGWMAFIAPIILIFSILFNTGGGYQGGQETIVIGTGEYVAISVGAGLIGALIGVLLVWWMTRVAKAAR